MNIERQATVPSDEQISAYLAGRLTPTQAESFEIYCLQHPEFAREVELSLQLRTGFRQLEPKLPPAPAKPRRLQSWLPVAIAASIAILSLSIYQLMPRTTARALLAAKTPSQLPPELRSLPVFPVTLVSLRSSAAAIDLAIPPGRLIQLRFPNDAEPTGEYSLELRTDDESWKEGIKVAGMHPASDGYVSAYVASEILIGHVWHITLHDSQSAQDASRQQHFVVKFSPPLPPPS